MTDDDLQIAIIKAIRRERKETGPYQVPPNGTRKMLIGIVAALLVAAVSASGGMLIAQGSRLAVVEEKTKEAVKPERMAVVETKVEALEKSIVTIEADGKASNSKLDALLGRFKVKIPE